MKKLLHSSLLLLTVLFAGSLKAQTTISTTVVDSMSYYCPLPASSFLSGWGTTTGYNDVTDNITVQIFWGDGQDTTFIADLYDGGMLVDNFYIWANHSYTMAGTFTPMVISTGPDGNDDTAYCNPLTFSASCIMLDGYAYEDNNANCVFDGGDMPLQWITVKITDVSTSAVVGWGCTDATGHYVTWVPSGSTSYEITAYSGAYNTVVCPSAGSYTFVPSGSMSFDFGLACTTTGHDLSVWAESWTDVPGGTSGFGYVHASNYSCIPVTGTITVTLDPNVTYTGMIMGAAPTSVVGNVLTWTHAFDAWPLSTSTTYLQYSTSTLTTAPVLGTAFFSASIDPLSGDVNTTNNSTAWTDIIGGPYDPNSKEVLPAGVGATGNVAPNTDFDYIIHFQNCGTAEAINIYIMDTISSNLDMSTFQVTGSSHAMTPIINGNIIRFDFPSIHLIDSVANEPLSHGWLSYHIQSNSGLANGTQIKNTAHIYFDYNPAVVTNTTLNTIDISMGAQELVVEANNNTLFPNPATNNFTVQFDEAVTGTLFMLDASGKTVKQINLNAEKSVVISTIELESGFYALSMPGVVLKQNRIQVIK